MDPEAARRSATVHLGGFDIEIRWPFAMLLTAYAVAGVVTALAGAHFEIGGRGGIAVHSVTFALLAFGAALFHELGHAYVGLALGRRPVGLVLKAGAAMRIEEARPGSRGASAVGESLVALGGPLASGLVGLAYLNVSSDPTSAFAWAGLLAIFDGLLNLVPVVNSDGNRVLQAFLHRSSPASVGNAALDR
jgi:Zn-dependent protease